MFDAFLAGSAAGEKV